MSYTLALLRTDLRSHLGQDETDLDNTAADRLLNRSWWFLCAKVRFSEKDAETSVTTTAGTREITLTIDEDAIQRLVIYNSTSETYPPLQKIDDYTMFGERSDDENAWSIPTRYSRRDSDLILDPVPNDEYTILIKYLREIEDIESSGPVIPREWHEVILWGAIARGFFARGDLSRGERYLNFTHNFINTLDTQEEKEVEDRPLSGFKVLRRKYP